jgi:hypothetical protein
MIFRCVVALAVVLLLHTTLALGQINSATLTGTVKDTSGAAVQGATMKVLQPATGAVRNSETNETGLYTVPFLQPGDYKVTVSKSGFQGVTELVTLQVNQIADLDFSLKVGQTTETVTVETKVEQLQTETSSLGTVIGSQDISDLPLNGRQFIQLLQLAPGTVPVSVSQSAVPDLGESGSNVTPAINGGSGRSNLFFVDGLYATDPFFSSLSISPSIDAIQEFQEQTHTDQAQFGGSTGGTVNLSTKGGTNQFHGTAYEYFRNDAISAAKPMSGGAPKTTYQQNQYGGSFSGPIVHNKLFFFGYYDGYRQLDQNIAYARVPTAAQLSGDFSGILETLYDPTTYNATTQTITAFPKNSIAGRQDPGMMAILKAYIPAPLPGYDCSVLENFEGCNFVNRANSTTNQDQYSIRGDYNAGKKDLIYGRYSKNSNTEISPGGIPNMGFNTGMSDINTGGTWVHTFSSLLISQITGGYNGVDHPQDQPQANAAAVFTQAGFTGFTDTPGGILVPKVPGIHPGGYFDINGGWGPIGPQHVIQISGSVTKQAGAHSLSLGAAYYHTWMYTNWAENDEYFGAKASWNPITLTGGDSMASLMMSLPDSADRQLGNSGVNLIASLGSVYAQDSWKMKHRLTMNYGVRWDYTTPVSEKDNYFSGFDINTATWYIAKGNKAMPSGQLPAGVVVLNRSTITTPDYADFSPRLGFSWLATPQTVVAAGGGLTYDNWSGSEQAAQDARGAWPVGASQGVYNLDEAGVTPGITAENPFIGQTTVIGGSPLGTGTGGGFLDTKWKDAYSWQWNFTIQHQFGAFGTVKTAYVGSSTSRAPIQINSNASTVLGPTWTAPFPSMGQFSVIRSIGHMSYNAFQAQYQKSTRNGLSFNSAFTWSKNINTGCSDFWEGCDIQNPYDLRADKGPNDVDVPIVLTASAVYAAPFGKGKTYVNEGPGAAILGGWKVNGMLTSRGGTPFSIGLWDNETHSNGGGGRPNVTGSTKGPKTRTEWFNKAAFSQPAKYTYGTSGRNNVRGPGYVNFDFSLFREFAIHERYKFEFRAESFDIFNHVNLGNPNTTYASEAQNSSVWNSFGTISGYQGNPRRFQLAGTFHF